MRGGFRGPIEAKTAISQPLLQIKRTDWRFDTCVTWQLAAAEGLAIKERSGLLAAALPKMGRPQPKARVHVRMVIAVVATLITCLALLATQLEFDRTDPHETIHHNRPHPRHATPRPRPMRVKGENVLLKIQNKLVATTDAPYVCVSLDWWPDEKVDWSHHTWNASSVIALQEVHSELRRALASLHPVALRVGGTLQDLVAYDSEDRAAPFDMSCPSSFRPAGDRAAFEGACVTLDLYDSVETLAVETNTPLIFGLSGLHGRTRDEGKCPKCDSKNCAKCWSGRWSASAGGARSLLKRAALSAKSGRGALAAVSLGNELCGQGGIAAHLSPAELAADFRRLQEEVKALFGDGKRTSISSTGRPYIIGPDCQLPLEKAYDYYASFNKEANVDALAFHLYWLGAGKLWRPFKKKLFDKIQ